MKIGTISSLFIVVIFFVCLSCKQEEVRVWDFTGTWVEETASSDTLVVNQEISMLTLNRGKELTKDGHWLPRFGSGVYSYQLRANQITLHYGFSSCLCPKDYSFNIENGRLTIGNFYAQSAQAAPVLTFRKIK